MSLVEAQQTQKQGQSVRLVLSPGKYQAVIFDMDGVVTQTATVHAEAWKEMFDGFLRQYSQEHLVPFQPFDVKSDYRLYVDGKAREEGVRSFLGSRGINLPVGNIDDPPELNSIYGLGNRKNDRFLKFIATHGVEAFPSTVQFIQDLKARGLQVAVISASRNATDILKSAGVLGLFDTQVDGLDAERLQLKSKPEPDIFCQAARQLGVMPGQAIVVEDALAGVQAGHAGEFALVIGVNRDNQAQLLCSHGANLVVNDLSELVLVTDQAAELTSPQANPWQLIYEGYDPGKEGIRETLCTLGNGYFATRGALFSAHDDGVHYPGTYLAGGYNRLTSQVGEHQVENEDLVNFPNWLSLNFRIMASGQPVESAAWFSLDQVELLFYRQTLNLQQGVLYRNIQFRDRQGRETLLIERRLVHMEHFHLAGLELSILPLNWDGRLLVRAALDGTVVNNNVASFRGLSNRHLEPLAAESPDEHYLFLKMQTNQSQLRVAQAARIHITVNNVAVESEPQVIRQADYIACDYQFEVTAHQMVVVEKVVAFYNSQDNAISESGLEAMKAVRRAGSFDQLVASQEKAWRHLWDQFDIDISAKQQGEQELPSLLARLHAFHVLQTVSHNSVDLDTNIPARGWHGEAYRGHIFWDNLFVFPFLNFRMPNISESLLKYHYRRLPEAHALAARAGFEGAMYPWQSGSNGEEETPTMVYSSKLGKWLPEYTHLQRHVNAAIVYNIWSYYQVTGDLNFLYAYGAEMMVEIARFWASVSSYNAALERYEIKGVIGPDEYHQRYPGRDQVGIDNNAYTNVMAVWCLCRALEVLDIMPEDHRAEVMDQLNIGPSELAHWNTISRKMRVDFFDNGLISQFEGYPSLQEFPWADYLKKHGNLLHIDEVMAAEGQSLDRYKIAKQADVLMLFYLFSAETLRELFDRLGYSLLPEAIPRIIDYYTRRTAHGSSLSRIANAWVLARSNRKRSWNLFMEALMADVADTQGGTTPEGIHLGAMGGTLDLIQRCYTGLELRNDILWFNPMLPTDLNAMSFSVHYRDNLLRIKINHTRIHIYISHSRGRVIQIGLNEQVHALESGRDYEFTLKGEHVLP
jgi:beta-phosphoglucomutase family hydrolase